MKLKRGIKKHEQSCSKCQTSQQTFPNQSIPVTSREESNTPSQIFNIHIHVTPNNEGVSSSTPVQPVIHLHFDEIAKAIAEQANPSTLKNLLQLNPKSVNVTVNDNCVSAEVSNSSCNNLGRISEIYNRESEDEISDVPENSASGKNNLKSEIGKNSEVKKSKDKNCTVINSNQSFSNEKNKKVPDSEQVNVSTSFSDKKNDLSLKKAVVLLKDIKYDDNFKNISFCKRIDNSIRSPNKNDIKKSSYGETSNKTTKSSKSQRNRHEKNVKKSSSGGASDKITKSPESQQNGLEKEVKKIPCYKTVKKIDRTPESQKNIAKFLESLQLAPISSDATNDTPKRPLTNETNQAWLTCPPPRQIHSRACSSENELNKNITDLANKCNFSEILQKLQDENLRKVIRNYAYQNISDDADESDCSSEKKKTKKRKFKTDGKSDTNDPQHSILNNKRKKTCNSGVESTMSQKSESQSDRTTKSPLYSVSKTEAEIVKSKKFLNFDEMNVENNNKTRSLLSHSPGGLNYEEGELSGIALENRKTKQDCERVKGNDKNGEKKEKSMEIVNEPNVNESNKTKQDCEQVKGNDKNGEKKEKSMESVNEPNVNASNSASPKIKAKRNEKIKSVKQWVEKSTNGVDQLQLIGNCLKEQKETLEVAEKIADSYEAELTEEEHMKNKTTQSVPKVNEGVQAKSRKKEQKKGKSNRNQRKKSKMIIESSESENDDEQNSEVADSGCSSKIREKRDESDHENSETDRSRKANQRKIYEAERENCNDADEINSALEKSVEAQSQDSFSKSNLTVKNESGEEKEDQISSNEKEKKIEINKKVMEASENSEDKKVQKARKAERSVASSAGSGDDDVSTDLFDFSDSDSFGFSDTNDEISAPIEFRDINFENSAASQVFDEYDYAVLNNAMSYLNNTLNETSDSDDSEECTTESESSWGSMNSEIFKGNELPTKNKSMKDQCTSSRKMSHLENHSATDSSESDSGANDKPTSKGTPRKNDAFAMSYEDFYDSDVNKPSTSIIQDLLMRKKRPKVKSGSSPKKCRNSKKSSRHCRKCSKISKKFLEAKNAFPNELGWNFDEEKSDSELGNLSSKKPKHKNHEKKKKRCSWSLPRVRRAAVGNDEMQPSQILKPEHSKKPKNATEAENNERKILNVPKDVSTGDSQFQAQTSCNAALPRDMPSTYQKSEENCLGQAESNEKGKENLQENNRVTSDELSKKLINEKECDPNEKCKTNENTYESDQEILPIVWQKKKKTNRHKRSETPVIVIDDSNDNQKESNSVEFVSDFEESLSSKKELDRATTSKSVVKIKKKKKDKKEKNIFNEFDDSFNISAGKASSSKENTIPGPARKTSSLDKPVDNSSPNRNKEKRSKEMKAPEKSQAGQSSGIIEQKLMSNDEEAVKAKSHVNKTHKTSKRQLTTESLQHSKEEKEQDANDVTIIMESKGAPNGKEKKNSKRKLNPEKEVVEGKNKKNSKGKLDPEEEDMERKRKKKEKKAKSVPEEKDNGHVERKTKSLKIKVHEIVDELKPSNKDFLQVSNSYKIELPSNSMTYKEQNQILTSQGTKVVTETIKLDIQLENIEKEMIRRKGGEKFKKNKSKKKKGKTQKDKLKAKPSPPAKKMKTKPNVPEASRKFSTQPEYIPLSASGPTKFAVAPLNKIKPYNKHEAMSFKEKMLFGSRVNRFKSNNDLKTLKMKKEIKGRTT